MTSLTFSLLLCLTLTTKTAHSAYTSISTAAQLKALANEVNAGTTYSGKTVTLTNDIDMSSITDFPCIGVYAANGIKDFRGTFDGYGYLIKNLKITTSSIRYAGLFGYSNGGTFKNIVIDSSSTVTNRESTCGYAAGIVGYAVAGIRQVDILNCVNMGTITGSGPKSKVGGIISLLYGFVYTANVVNCVNLGSIVYTGTTSGSSKVGGVVAWMTNSGEAPSVLNCVNIGKITATHDVVGAVVGECTATLGVIQNCYWLSGTAPQCYKGDPTTASGNYAFDASYTLTTGSALATTLNNYVTSLSTTYSLQKWGTVAFNTNGGMVASGKMTMFLMLGTPDTPTKEGHSFNGWYTDPGFSTPWSSSTRYGSGVGATLYAKWSINQYTVTYISNNGTVITETCDYGTLIQLSTPTKTGYTFSHWSGSDGNNYNEVYSIKAESVSLTPQWVVNNYTVTFDFGNGTKIEKIFEYNETIKYFNDPEREGYEFIGWDDNITEMPAKNITINVVWNEIPTNYVVIEFREKDLSKKEIKEIISKYTDSTYEIKIVQYEGSGTMVIVKFKDVEEATNFIDTIKESSDENIISVKYFISDVYSFSTILKPLSTAFTWLFVLFCFF